MIKSGVVAETDGDVPAGTRRWDGRGGHDRRRLFLWQGIPGFSWGLESASKRGLLRPAIEFPLAWKWKHVEWTNNCIAVSQTWRRGERQQGVKSKASKEAREDV